MSASTFVPWRIGSTPPSRRRRMSSLAPQPRPIIICSWGAFASPWTTGTSAYGKRGWTHSRRGLTPNIRTSRPSPSHVSTFWSRTGPAPRRPRPPPNFPPAAAGPEPRLNLLVADGAGRILEGLLGLGLDALEVRPEAARSYLLRNLPVAALVPRLRHRHPERRDEYRMLAPHVVQEEGEGVPLALHGHQGSLRVRKRVGPDDGQLDAERARAGEGAGGGDIAGC